jgi:uroporphyrinogen-III synthase
MKQIILLTRPKIFSESLAALLQKRGYATMIEPILEVEPRNGPRPDMDRPGAVMLTSRNALLMLKGKEDQVEDLFGLPCFCVGHRTAEDAKAFGFRDIVESKGDSLTLARAIIATAPPSTPLLHIVGEDKSSAASELLVRSGFEVDSWVVYKALPAEAFSLPLQAALTKGEIAAILFFSPRAASVFATLAKRYGVEACFAGLTCIGLSKSVMDALRPLTFAAMHIAEEPTEASMVACLQEIYPIAGG